MSGNFIDDCWRTAKSTSVIIARLRISPEAIIKCIVSNKAGRRACEFSTHVSLYLSLCQRSVKYRYFINSANAIVTGRPGVTDRGQVVGHLNIRSPHGNTINIKCRRTAGHDCGYVMPSRS